MRKIVRLDVVLASAAGLMFISASQEVRAAELQSVAGASISLGDVSGAAYYTAEQDGYRLVATLASGVNATPIRLITTLQSGQKVTVSVPRGTGEPEIKVEFNRIADRLFVNDVSKLPGRTN